MISEDIAAKAGRRLSRIAGQVRGIQKMIAEGRYCVDVLNQIEAVRAALVGVAGVVLRNHIETCVVGAVKSSRKADRHQKIDELITLYGRFCGGSH